MYLFWLQTERQNPGSEYGSQAIPGSFKPSLLEQSVLMILDSDEPMVG